MTSQGDGTAAYALGWEMNDALFMMITNSVDTLAGPMAWGFGTSELLARCVAGLMVLTVLAYQCLAVTRSPCHLAPAYLCCGRACLSGIAKIDDADIIVFADADYSDHLDQMQRLVDPIAMGKAQLVIGSRVLGERQDGASGAQKYPAPWLACCAQPGIFWDVSSISAGLATALAACST